MDAVLGIAGLALVRVVSARHVDSIMLGTELIIVLNNDYNIVGTMKGERKRERDCVRYRHKESVISSPIWDHGTAFPTYSIKWDPIFAALQTIKDIQDVC
jgi:hypothetical protein